MKIKIGGSKGKAWEWDDVRQIIISSSRDSTHIDIDVIQGDHCWPIGLNEAGTIRLDNRKEKTGD